MSLNKNNNLKIATIFFFVHNPTAALSSFLQSVQITRIRFVMGDLEGFILSYHLKFRFRALVGTEKYFEKTSIVKKYIGDILWIRKPQ